jgi:hypothetical protein
MPVNNKHIVKLFFTLLTLLSIVQAQAKESWQIIVSQSLRNDKAITLAISDLQKTAKKYGIQIDILMNNEKLKENTIFLGSPSQNKRSAQFINSNKIKLQKIDDEQGFEIKTITAGDKRIVIVSGGSVLGDVYGLYWLWDRLKVYKKIPEINTLRIPRLKIRYMNGRSKKEIENALRYGATWVTGNLSANLLVPWDSEPEKTENAKNRETLRELINYAHQLHLKFFVYEDEFSFHPSLLKEFGAKLTPEDPAFWDAVQTKYRRLLQAIPEIDGVRIRTGEATRVGGSYRAFDVMHSGECCDWSLAKRYRTWVKKIYNVVVGEYNKIYFQRTWVTSAYEQHSMAAVYKNIFTDDIPVYNLYMSPYLSTTDRFFFQPYNPTFNLTPHNMIVLLAPLDYHGHRDAKIFPTFPGSYYQGGLKLILSPKKSNVKGADFGAPSDDRWDSWNITFYTASRLAWNPDEDLKTIAKDFAAMYFDQAAAADIADIFLLSPEAYKYGIYIEPVAHGDFSSLRHLRLTTFPAKGLPRLDSGKKHINFLYDIYLRCHPWQEETLLYLDHGLEKAKQMKEKSQSAEPFISNKKSADRLLNSVELTWQLINTNNLYVKTFFAYFDYRDKPTEDNKKFLQKTSQKLQQSMSNFLNTPNCVYRLDGMVQLQHSVNQALKNLQEAEKILDNAPDDDGIKILISGQQKKSQEILQKYAKKAVKVVHWKGRVDGRDLLKIHLDQIEIEHLRYDPILDKKFKFFNPLPEKAYTIIVKDIQSRSFHPFVLEQPSKENNFTATIYLSDFPMHGYGRWEFEVYYLKEKPEKLGLLPPWK